MTRTASAWDLIGLVEPDESVRIVGGRALYESVDFNETGRQKKVRLARLYVGKDGIRQVNRYVEPDTLLEIVKDP